MLEGLELHKFSQLSLGLLAFLICACHWLHFNVCVFVFYLGNNF